MERMKERGVTERERGDKVESRNFEIFTNNTQLSSEFEMGECSHMSKRDRCAKLIKFSLQEFSIHNVVEHELLEDAMERNSRLIIQKLGKVHDSCQRREI